MKVQELPAESGPTAMEQEMAGAQDTIYLCNFRVSVDGEWLCLKELQDVEFNMQESITNKPLLSSSPEVPVQPFGRDPVVIERSNLVNISKLVVKELIEQSLRYGRMLDSDHMPLQHFFIVLEHVLRHGLKPKKGLLGPKKELWDILQMVEKYTPEAQDITASVRDLPTVRTHMGRARAWLRLALMQKKLADYLKVLIDHKDEALVEYFEPDALMLSDEAIIIIGLLVGLNVIDCNLCVKEEDLDCPQGVIDFSLYLRSASQVSNDSSNGDETGDAMTTVLDQKNYIEELNRHLNATVTNLQTKVESLTTTNALMKEDLAIAKNNLMALFEENRLLRRQCGREGEGEGYVMSASGVHVTSADSGKGRGEKGGNAEELRQRLEEERRLRKEADDELEIQMCMKAEMEVAMKLLEKDIHEKQDTIISLRRQLDDIKLINLEMYKKLQECEMDLTQKGEMVSRLQAKAGQIGKILNNLEKYNHLMKDHKKTSERRSDKRQSCSKSVFKENATTASKNADKDERQNTCQMDTELRQPITSDSTDSFIKLDLDLDLDETNDGLRTILKTEKCSCGLFQGCEASLAHKAEFISKLEAKMQSMTDTIESLEYKYKESESMRLTTEQLKQQVDLQAAHVEEQANSIEGDLKLEREWRKSLQDSMQQDRERISKLQIENGQLKLLAQKYAQLQEDYYTLKDHNMEQDKTLEELGGKLKDSKLQISDLKEEINRNRIDGTWAKDNTVSNCSACSKEFNLTRRRHHCRNCGEIFCNTCSDNTMALPSSAKPVRVCDDCHLLLLGRSTNTVMN